MHQINSNGEAATKGLLKLVWGGGWDSLLCAFAWPLAGSIAVFVVARHLQFSAANQHRQTPRTPKHSSMAQYCETGLTHGPLASLGRLTAWLKRKKSTLNIYLS